MPPDIVEGHPLGRVLGEDDVGGPDLVEKSATLFGRLDVRAGPGDQVVNSSVRSASRLPVSVKKCGGGAGTELISPVYGRDRKRSSRESSGQTLR